MTITSLAGPVQRDRYQSENVPPDKTPREPCLFGVIFQVQVPTLGVLKNTG